MRKRTNSLDSIACPEEEAHKKPSPHRQNSVLSTDAPDAIAAINGEALAQSDFHRLGWVPDPWPASGWMHLIPFLLVFLRGALFLREAWQILTKHPRYLILSNSERNLRLATALTGGFVAIGAGIINILLYLQAGLLGTTLAVTLAPIVLTSIGVGFYCMTLLRDLYRLGEINRELKPLEKMSAVRSGFSRHVKKLTMDRNHLLKEIVFGAIGTIGIILVLSVSIISLTTAATSAGNALFLIAGALAAISTAPAVLNLFKKAYGYITNCFNRKPTLETSDNQAPCAPSNHRKHAPATHAAETVFTPAPFFSPATREEARRRPTIEVEQTPARHFTV